MVVTEALNPSLLYKCAALVISKGVVYGANVDVLQLTKYSIVF
jgi:hypothetical protein